MVEEDKIFEWDQTAPKKLEDLPPEVIGLFNFFKNRYVPADAGTATIRMTTSEISQELMEHSGTPISIAMAFKFLSDNGYTYSATGTDMQFTWLLKFKE